MPAAVVALAASWAGSAIATGIFGLAAGSFGAAIVGGIIATGLTKVGQSLLGGGRGGGGGSSVKDSGILVNSSSTISTIPVVYGIRRVGAKRVYVANSGDNNKYLHLVCSLSEGEIYGIGNIYFNNVPVASASGIATQTRVESGEVVFGTASTSPIADGAKVTAFYTSIPNPNDPATVKDNPYTSKTEIYVHYGTDAQTVDTNIQTAVGNTVWTNDHRLRGVAYVYIRLEYDRDVFGGAPDITIDIGGKKVRKYTTTTSYTTAPGTDGEFNNPAWVLLDYLTNTRYGKAIDYTDIDLQSFIDAAAYCNESQTVSTTPAYTLGNRYTVNGHCDPDNTIFTNIKNILAACSGSLVFSGGKYRLLIDKPVADADIGFEFTEENIIGGINIQLPSKVNMANKVKVNFFDRERDWQPNVTIIDIPAYRVASVDGVNNVLEKEIELQMVSSYNRASYIGRLYLNQSRAGTSVQFNAAPSALVCDVGDVVFVKHPTPNWGYDSTVGSEYGLGKRFKITGMKLKEDGNVEITAIEYDSTVYTDLGNIPTRLNRRNLTTYASGFFSPQSNPVSPPTSLTVTNNTSVGGTPAISVSFTASPDPRVVDYVIDVTNQTTTESQHKVITGAPTGTISATITGLNNKVTYRVEVYARTADGRLSEALT